MFRLRSFGVLAVVALAALTGCGTGAQPTPIPATVTARRPRLLPVRNHARADWRHAAAGTDHDRRGDPVPDDRAAHAEQRAHGCRRPDRHDRQCGHSPHGNSRDAG